MFGITMDDLLTFLEIESYGFTVERAYELFRKGELPEELQKTIQKYENRLKNEDGEWEEV